MSDHRTTATATARHAGVIPTHETQAADFYQSRQEDHDNAGDTAKQRQKFVCIGILDTGVDPATHRVMDDGVTPRLLDVVDCTGSGDVELTETAIVQDNHTVVGLTGRTLAIDPAWTIQPFPGSTNTTVRLGVKRGYDLFPSALIGRVRAQRAAAHVRSMAPHVASLRQQLTQLEMPSSSSSDDGSTPTQRQREKENLQALLEVCSADPTDDPGPLYDCLVFWDGTHYRAAVYKEPNLDSDNNADNKESDKKESCTAPVLASTRPLAAFAVEREYGTLDEQLNFGVQFYNTPNEDNGDVIEKSDGDNNSDPKTAIATTASSSSSTLLPMVLSLVCDCSPHGTHVASICTGVAPQAQIISFKIGEPRLSGMETGPSLARAMHAAKRHNCDLINLSYGEDAKLPNRGRIIELAEQLVWRDQVLFVAAAGNQGPALSTLKAPGGTSSVCLAVAAAVSPDMSDTVHSRILKQEEGDDTDPETTTTYTWSSTGPTTDGDIGVSVCAPGGAIGTIPNWCLQRSKLMNGTSMSAPHVAGCVALLIAALKVDGVSVSPARVQRALENTANILPNVSPLQQGSGMVQVQEAYKYLQANNDVTWQDLSFRIEVINRGRARGIYLRQPSESSLKNTFSVQVAPQFRLQDGVNEQVQREQIDLELHCTLQSTAPWVRAPSNVVITNNGRSFEVDVDPTQLSAGIHAAKVFAVETENPGGKAAFTVPVTVIKPLPEQRDVDLGSLSFKSAEVKRFFVVPPPGTTWMEVTLKDSRRLDEGASSKSMIALHTVQLLPHASFRENECSRRFGIVPEQTIVTSVAVEAGVTCEVALGRFWSTRSATKLQASIRFRGIRAEPQRLNLVSGSGGAMVKMYCDLADETVGPSASLKKWQSPIRPKTKDAVIRPLGVRDCTITNKKTYELILTYTFEQEEKGSFIPRLPALQGLLYESGFESQCMMVFDGEKKYLGMSDATPSSIEAPKGTVVIRLQVRHDTPNKLEQLKTEQPVLWIERKLSKEIELSVYSTKEDLMLASKDKFKKGIMRKGSSAAAFIAEPSVEKLPSGCSAGSRLVGTVSYGAASPMLPGSSKKPGGYPITYVLGPKAAKVTATEVAPAEPKTKPTPEQRLDEALRDLKIEHLGKLTKEEKEGGKFEEQYLKLEAEYSGYVPLLMAKLKYLDSHPKRSDRLNDIITTAQAVSDCTSADELALNLGRKLDSEDGDAVKEREQVKEKKLFLIEALVRMALALSDMETEDASKKFEETVKLIQPWAELDALKYAALYIERETRANRHGLALKQINKLLDKETKEKDAIKSLTRSDLLAKRASIFAKLGYTSLFEYDTRSRVVSCPKDYAPF